MSNIENKMEEAKEHLIMVDRSHWETKVKFMEHSKIFLDYFASDLIQRSIDLFFSQQETPRPVRILDVATGTGLIPFKFIDEKLLGEEWNYSLDGIDFATSMIEASQFKKHSRIEDQQVPFDFDKLQFQVMDGQDLKFPDESFDVVYANMGVLFYPNIVQGLSEIRRVLKNGGMAFLNSWTEDFPTRVQYHVTHDILGTPNRFAIPVFSLADPQIFEQRCKDAGFGKVQVKQLTQSLKMTFGEAQAIIGMGSQVSEFVKKYLRENPEVTSTEKELMDRMEELCKERFKATCDQDEIEIISTANVAILSK